MGLRLGTIQNGTPAGTTSASSIAPLACMVGVYQQQRITQQGGQQDPTFEIVGVEKVLTVSQIDRLLCRQKPALCTAP